VVQVPQRYGFISVACAVYESDDESSSDRDDLLAEFAGRVGSGIIEAEDTFFEVLGESIASGWQLGSVEAVTFRRAQTVEVVSFRPKTLNQWLDGGDRVEWSLAEQANWRVDVPDTIVCGCEACTDEVVLPPMEVDVPRLDFGPKLGNRKRMVEKDGGQEVPIDFDDIDPRCRRRSDADSSADGPERISAGPDAETNA
jgi:hypothetical protein